ncbi:MAG: hypothetical protein V4725_16875 [Bacteroidota bacterium]
MENIILKDLSTGEERVLPTKVLFVYIGTRPGTGWLDDLVLKNDKGYILSGSDVMKSPFYNTTRKLQRANFLPETSVPGIFAAGDVRLDAMAGISAAKGEGSMVVRFVRKYLQEM